MDDLELYGVSGLKIAPNCKFFKEFIPGDWDFIINSDTVWGKFRFQVKNPPVEFCCVMAATMESFWNKEVGRLYHMEDPNYPEFSKWSDPHWHSAQNEALKQAALWGDVCSRVHNLLVDDKLKD